MPKHTRRRRRTPATNLATDACRSGKDHATPLATLGALAAEHGRELFERETPLPDAWHFYEARDAAVLALTEERDKVATIPWLAWDSECFGQQTSGVPTITRKRLAELQASLNQMAA